MKKWAICTAAIMLIGLGTAGPVTARGEGLIPRQVFLHFWKAFMDGDPETVKEYMRADRVEALTAADLKYRGFYPPLIEVEQEIPGGEGIFLLELRGTYVHPYETEAMGSLAEYEQRFGKLEIVDETWDSLEARLPRSFAEHLRQFIDKEGIREIWLLDIPGRAMLLKEDNEWRVDVYHFDDQRMRRNAPRRLILPGRSGDDAGGEALMSMPETGT